MVAKEQAIRTNTVKAKIDKAQKNCNRMLCEKAGETLHHVVSKCGRKKDRCFRKNIRHIRVGMVFR